MTRALVRYRVVISGRVQGVWFRDSCRQEARARGVHGWVANRSDGTVEAAFEGDEMAVAQCVSWCRQGPPRAVVTGVDVTEESPTGESGFQVR
jgi:acylphosphatase